MPKWLQIILNIAVNAGTAYVAQAYPAQLPAVLPIGAAIQAALTNHAYNTVPPPPASKP